MTSNTIYSLMEALIRHSLLVGVISQINNKNACNKKMRQTLAQAKHA